MKDTRPLRKAYDDLTARIESLRDELLARPHCTREEFVEEGGYGYTETFEQYVARRRALRGQIEQMEREQFKLNTQLFV
jgi:hypothetical protein